MARTRAWLVASVLALGTPLPGFALAPQPVGGEFQVNTFKQNNQYLPVVRFEDDGDFVIAWASYGQDGGSYGIVARRFGSSGIALTDELRVNSFTDGNQFLPALGVDAEGDFVVAWASFGQDGDGYGVFARRFTSSGVAQASEFQVNSYTASSQFLPTADMGASAAFVIVWASALQDGSQSGIFGRRFDAAGAAVGDEFQVNSYSTGTQSGPVLAREADGDFVVAWVSYGQDGSSDGVFARRFASGGTANGVDFQVNAFATGEQDDPELGIDGDGDFVVAWTSPEQDGSGNGVFARRFNAGGAAQAVEFRVNTLTIGDDSQPAVGVEHDGDFVVTWTSSQDGDYTGIFARGWSSSGVALGVELQVNSYTTGTQASPSVDSDAGSFVVAWHSNQDDGQDVFAQRFTTLAVLDIDGSGSITPLTDGLLVLRFLFGFTGTTLTSGAVDLTACSRCNSSAIEAYLKTLT
jgi:hypothetical protein